ncbi:F0F1 ATP synthase subunit alpha [Albimonas sp. CAU 1670]|uniref:F0F1 ATP synthase subunit alpha n=1 Tax=Albimonas sp. CAU 1670 TaxID=3032599 RepID=UPI0023DC9387|nr:F0F1 ATP synthase subunit alpha [Albimonas sp. CAU 1670]MDF2235454.1 F0F1 ATP synthase subunit alpha [Albimonas sp. CAU 1670]
MSDAAPNPDWTARLDATPLGPEAEELGRILSLADGLAVVSGLPGAGMGEILLFPGEVRALVLTLEEDALRAAFLDPSDALQAGDPVRRSGEILRVPVGEALLGRIVDPLGRPLDDLGPVPATQSLEAERPAPAIIERDFVSRPLETGVLVVDALFAVGRGQRELIVGERATGKTSLAVDAILNQSDVISVYVAIGERTSAVERVIDALREGGALARSIVVVAPATAPPALRWLAPFAATAMAEHFRDAGGDALIVYDDLTKHAAVHRELALLARQPPGREAFPGDIFYLHARLLERSARLSPAKGGGSLTALPIAEIEAGDLAGYIPTNLISIADGQIVLSAPLFAANQRPAVDIGLSVSRVGGKAQRKALKSVSGRVRLDYAQYLELRMFARFGGFADAGMKARIARGERIGAVLSQARFSPLSQLTQTALLAALAEGLLDPVPLVAIPALKPRLARALAAAPDVTEDWLDDLDDARRETLLALARDCIADLPAEPA